MVKFGQTCREFLDKKLRGLELEHLEVDGQLTFVAKKQGRLHDLEKDNPKIGD